YARDLTIDKVLGSNDCPAVKVLRTYRSHGTGSIFFPDRTVTHLNDDLLKVRSRFGHIDLNPGLSGVRYCYVRITEIRKSDHCPGGYIVKGEIPVKICRCPLRTACNLNAHARKRKPRTLFENGTANGALSKDSGRQQQ